jgi:hypothetical protein
MGCWLYRLRARIEQKSNHFFTDVAEQVRGVVSVHPSYSAMKASENQQNMLEPKI